MIDGMFDFEKKMAGEMKISYEHFMKLGLYLYFRSSLIECWSTLNRLNTYPNMIQPLKIDP